LSAVDQSEKQRETSIISAQGISKPQNFEPSHGMCQLPGNFRVPAEFCGIICSLS